MRFWVWTKRVFFTSGLNCGTYHNLICIFDENQQKSRLVPCFQGLVTTKFGVGNAKMGLGNREKWLGAAVKIGGTKAFF